MAAARKKVLVRTHNREVFAGYLPEAGFLVDGVDRFSLLDPSGRMQEVALATVRWVAYVRDFNLGDRDNPERLVRRTFLPRPRSPGLWLRLTLVAGDTIEGLAPTDLTLLDGLIAERGLTLIPPDIRLNTQRLYVPRTGLSAVELLGVITQKPAGKRPASATRVSTEQADLFPPAR